MRLDAVDIQLILILRALGVKPPNPHNSMNVLVTASFAIMRLAKCLLLGCISSQRLDQSTKSAISNFQAEYDNHDTITQ